MKRLFTQFSFLIVVGDGGAGDGVELERTHAHRARRGSIEEEPWAAI